MEPAAFEAGYAKFSGPTMSTCATARRCNGVFREEGPFDLIVHCAAQPSHDLAAKRPYDDFDVNAGGTLNVLEATRQLSPDAVFVHMSTNKVYGDAPNELPLKELPQRWDYAREEDFAGINGADAHRRVEALDIRSK